MIGLRILHLVSRCDGSLAAAGAINLMRWLRENGHATALLTPGGDREAEIVADDFQVMHYTDGGLGWWLGGRKELLRQVQNWNPDLFHVHDLEALPIALSIAESMGLSVIAGSDAMAEAAQAQPLRNALVGWVVVPSEVHRAHYISRLGLSRDQVTVLPYGVDLRRVSATIPRQADAPVIIGAIQPFAPDSGLETLVEAVSILVRDQVPVRCLLVGAGPDEAGLRARIDQLGLAASIELKANDAPMAVLVTRLDLLVHPAHGNLTPAVLEAMACGRPVVAALGGGITELVHDGCNGLLVPNGDAVALAEALRGMVTDRARVRALGQAARQVVGERFDIALVGQAAQELYRSAFGGALTAGDRAEGTTVYRRLTEPRGLRPGG